MRLLRLTIAAMLIGCAMLYVALGEHKAIGIMAGVVAVITARFLIPDLRRPMRTSESDEGDR